MIARRYAKALLQLSVKEDKSEDVKNEITAVGGLMRQKKYFKFFTNKLIHAGRKLEVLGFLSPLTRDFMKLVISNKREEYLDLISREYVSLLNKRNNVIDAVVTSSLPMTNEQKDALKEKLEKYMAKKINLSFETDKDLIGGIRVKYGDKIIDGTVSGMLKGYLNRLMEN